MKAVVAEIKNHDVAALTDEGFLIKIKNNNYTVGQEIEVKVPAAKKQANKPAKIAAWVASVAAAIVLVRVSIWAYFTPYTYVSLDVNPSIEYSVNRFDRVLSVTAVNGDGREILEKLNLNNKTIDEAIKNTVDQIEEAGYFKGTDPGGIEISTSSENAEDAENLAKQLQATAQQAVDDTASAVEVEAVSVGHQRVLDAKALGTTPGKLNLVQKLQASVDNPGSIDIKEWLNKPVKVIMKAIEENKKEDSTQKESSSSGSTTKQTGSKPADSSSSAIQNGKTSSAQSSSSKIVGKPNSTGSGTAVTQNEDSQVTSKQNTTSSESSSSNTTQKKTNQLGNSDNQNQDSSKNKSNGNGNGNGNNKSK